jgi:hypothetical protein
MIHRAALRGLVLLVLAWCLSIPPQRLVVVGPPQTVATRNVKMGVHTRLTDEVEEWKIQRTLEMVREMGSPWVVEYFPWGYYEPAKGKYDWRHPDLVINHAVAQGLTIIARIDLVPEWARPPQTTFRYLDVAHYDDYAAFCAAFAARYAGRVRYLVIWNEPNLSFEWGYRPPDPRAYAALLCRTSRAVKEANPQMQVLMAGLAPTLAPAGSEWGMDDLVFLRGVYAAGGGDCCDGLAIHAYGLTAPANDPADPAVVNFRRAALLREVMVAQGDGNKLAYITEGGWNDHPRWTKAVRPYQRIEYTVRAYEMARTEWDWCAAVGLWAFRYPWPQKTYQDNFSFVTTDFVPKPLYQELRHYARGEPFEYLEETRP